MLLLLPMLVAAALATEGGDEAGADALAVNQLCPKVPPDGWTQDYGLEQHRKKGTALNAARDEAREHLRNRVCAGMELAGPRCTYLQRHMIEYTWGWEEKKNLACAIFAINNHFLDTYEADTASFRMEIDRLADGIAAAVGKVPLDIDKPTWPEGCVAGAGLPIVSALRASLSRHPELRLVGSDRYEAGAARLSLHLAMAGSAVQVDGVVSEGKGEARPVGGFSFPADLLAVSGKEARECASDAALGLKAGEKLGANELRVEVDLASDDGFACEGSPLTATIRVNQPARVQLYSVLPDQSAWLVWPPPKRSDGDRLQGAETLAGEAAVIPIRLEYGADERLVAIAVREGQGFFASDGWHGFCKSSRPMGPSLYPSDAAVGVGSYHTLGPGEGRCGKVSFALPDVAAALESAPACGAR